MSTNRPKDAQVKKSLKRRLLKQQGGVCKLCKGMGTGDSGYNPLEPHHKIPVHKGGKTEEGNLEILCRKCHVKEHQKDIQENLQFEQLYTELLSTF